MPKAAMANQAPEKPVGQFRYSAGRVIAPKPTIAASEALIASQRHVTHRSRLPNGLSIRADTMARLVARGTPGSEAYRQVYRKALTPERDASRAWSISKHERFKYAVAAYRMQYTEGEEQNAHSMRDFVLSQLVERSQSAPDAVAVRCLELLGKSEALFTDVRRTERTLNPNDIAGLKAQLEQRLSAALLRYMPGLSLGHGTGGQAETVESGLADATLPQAPLEAMGTPRIEKILIPPDGSSISGSMPEISEVDMIPQDGTRLSDGSSFHRLMCLDDL